MPHLRLFIASLFLSSSVLAAPVKPFTCEMVFTTPPTFSQRVLVPIVYSRLPVPKIPEPISGTRLVPREAPEQELSTQQLQAIADDKAAKLKLEKLDRFNLAAKDEFHQKTKSEWRPLAAHLSTESLKRILSLAGPGGIFFGKASRALGDYLVTNSFQLTHQYSNPYSEMAEPGTVGALGAITRVEKTAKYQAKMLMQNLFELADKGYDDEGVSRAHFQWPTLSSNAESVEKSERYYHEMRGFGFKDFSVEEYAQFENDVKFIRSSPEILDAFKLATGITANAVLLNARYAPGTIKNDLGGAYYYGKLVDPQLIEIAIGESYAELGWLPGMPVGTSHAMTVGVAAVEASLDVRNLPLYELRPLIYDKLFPKIPLNNEKLNDLNPEWFAQLTKYLNRIGYKITAKTDFNEIAGIKAQLDWQRMKIHNVRFALDKFVRDSLPLARELNELEAHVARRREAVADHQSAELNWGYVEQDVKTHILMFNSGLLLKQHYDILLDRFDAGISRMLTHINAVRSARALGTALPPPATMPALPPPTDDQLSPLPSLALPAPAKDPNDLY